MKTGELLRWPVDVMARPGALIENQTGDDARGAARAIATSVRISIFYFANVLLYALPLTLAGFGVSETGTAPGVIASRLAPIVDDPDAFWQLTVALVQNSSFLFVATVLTFGTFHLGVLLTGSSTGVVRSLRTVSYSTGIYLAIMFTAVWYVSTSPSIRVADEFLIYLQAEFFYVFIDLLEVGLDVPGGRREPVDLGRLTAAGQGMFVLLLLSATYYLYVLYLGARVAHRATRFEALVAVGFVAFVPAMYVLGVIAVTLATI